MGIIKVVTGILEFNDGRVWLGYKTKHHDYTGPGGKVDESDIFLTLKDAHIRLINKETEKPLNLRARIIDTNKTLSTQEVRELTNVRHEKETPTLLYDDITMRQRFDLLETIDTKSSDQFYAITKDNIHVPYSNLVELIYRSTLTRETKEEIKGLSFEITNFIGTYQYESKGKSWERHVYQMKKLKGNPNITYSDAFDGFIFKDAEDAMLNHEMKKNILAPGMFEALNDYIKLTRK